MSIEQHPNLEAFVAGKLDEESNGRVMAHLAICDACLERADILWMGRPESSAEIGIPDLNVDLARSLQHKIISRVRRSNLSGEAIKLGTQGFLDVLLAMIRPIFMRDHAKSKGAQ